MFFLLLALSTTAPFRPPTTLHYHIVSRTTSDLDLTAVGQPAQSFTMTLSAYVSITTTDSAAGKLVSAVVDSSSFDGGDAAQYLPPEMTASPKGAVFDAYLVPGQLTAYLIHGDTLSARTPRSSMTPSPVSVQAAQLGPALEALLIGFRPVKAGDVWTDSARVDSAAAQGAATGKRVVSWTAKAGDGGALQLDGTWTGESTVGTGQMQMALQLTGETHATTHPGELAETVTSTGGGQANMNLAGNAIPMRVHSTMTATRIP